MKFDLKTPCRNCPFRSDESRITFRGRERATEIAEQAYRNGFPCHLSAVLVEDDPYEEDGYVEGEGTQHCIGFLIMKMREGSETCWPGVDNDEELVERLRDQVDMSAPVFDSEEDFIEANADERFDDE